MIFKPKQTNIVYFIRTFWVLIVLHADDLYYYYYSFQSSPCEWLLFSDDFPMIFKPNQTDFVYWYSDFLGSVSFTSCRLPHFRDLSALRFPAATFQAASTVTVSARHVPNCFHNHGSRPPRFGELPPSRFPPATFQTVSTVTVSARRGPGSLQRHGFRPPRFG